MQRARRGSVAVLLLILFGTVTAEPYLAVSKGLHCSACHSSAAGGGRRNAFGNVYAQSELPARRFGDGDGDGDKAFWTGEINKWLAVGGNIRAGYAYTDTPNTEETSEFDVKRATLYIEAQLIPDRLSVYIDQQVAPNASVNREAYIRLKNGNGNSYLAVGQFFIPYGLRLEDDSAFVRQATGVNFAIPDRGIQVGYESGSWSTIASVTNGSGGGSETDTSKQFSILGVFVQPGWRVGVSANVNNADAGDREMFGVFAGVKTGPIAWLAEIDQITDDIAAGVSQEALAGLLEANWMFRQGHNLKISYDTLDPNDALSGDFQTRISLIWEYTPMQFLQGRIGLRSYDGIAAVDAQNRDVFFAEMHGYF